MTAFDAVLVHDGECPFCSAAAPAMRRTQGVGAIAHDEMLDHRAAHGLPPGRSKR